ncbi:MAG: hypothetical protein HGB18_03650 [Candidatus Moranbacteria bacterium]|nr:hypothetical protein [Candidatus Moranbacteria bacterium]
MQNTRWSEIDFVECGLQDGVIRNAEEAGYQFALFLKNGGRVNAGSAITSRSLCGVKETALLRPVATGVASGGGDLDEVTFFRSRAGGIWVSPSFREKFGSTFRKSRASDRKYVASELKQSANDTVIRADLPGAHLSKLGDIARFIKVQRGGKKGILLNNGLANIFYVEDENGQVFAVNFRWNSAVRTWFVVVWKLGEHGDWNAGNQVLCPSNAVL